MALATDSWAMSRSKGNPFGGRPIFFHLVLGLDVVSPLAVGLLVTPGSSFEFDSAWR